MWVELEMFHPASTGSKFVSKRLSCESLAHGVYSADLSAVGLGLA